MSESTGERPTFTQAFASEAPAVESPTTTPSPESATTESASAAATEQPASQETGDVTPAKGPLPYERHEAILKGAYQERDTYKQQLDALSWAKDVDRDHVSEMVHMSQLYNQDRPGWVVRGLVEGLNDPQLAPAILSHPELRSVAAKLLGTRVQAEAEAEIEADIPAYDANGQLVSRTYSDVALAKIRARDKEALKRELLAEIAPIKQTFERQEAAAKMAEHKQRMDQKVDSIIGRLTKLTLFKEHEGEIAAAMDLPEFSGLDPIEAAYAAYHHVVDSKLQASHKSQTLDELKTKAAASTVNPTAAVVATTQRPRSLTDPSLTW